MSQQVDISNIDKVDLLFVIDNSSSMEDKQANLRRRVPQLVQALVTGQRRPDDPNPFPPIKDLHIAVVDSDMGLPGITGIPHCTGFGHDGLFQHTPVPSPENPQCDAAYPTFLSYSAYDPSGASALELAQDFGCIANVGAMGCGFEQPLEAALKALWPAADARVQFLGTPGTPQAEGHGDRENAGFLRNDPAQGPALLAIILLSDEDDGSTSELELYAPSSALPSGTWVEPSTRQDLNLRALIGKNREHLFPIQRYVNGLKALRPGQENLIVFAAIVGVPLDLVDETATARVDFSDPLARDAYYDRILADPRMQHTPDATPTPSKMELPACETSFGKGYPGRRYIEVAKGFGANATIYSICEPDYTPALEHVIDLIAERVRPVCLPRALTRSGSGKVACDVVWELPTAGARTTLDAPLDCAERPEFLSAPAPGQHQFTPQGNRLCNVTQLAVSAGQVAAGEGWYYDDFSGELAQRCDAATPQRVAFTRGAKPPTGVKVKLVCLNETQRVADSSRPALPNASGRVATIGSSCTLSGSALAQSTADPDQLCVVQWADGTRDESLLCHPETNTCARSCQVDSDCPPAWVCDTRPETLARTVSAKRPLGAAICVNPTCAP